MFYRCRENKGPDQLRGYCEADSLICVFVFVYAKSLFSHNEAHMLYHAVIDMFYVSCMNRCMTEPLKSSLRPVKTQIKLGVHPI